ncbi:RPM1-interacting protein 4-like [Actinidia eriantha]|uniref:RPM1-interacting protein 4-like n=1 Tax=Actinidia eriantha TaxID=165200 RepID=UPI00258F2E46|nr:RPM1-interacting protein 4-like [Actinidia eriantha]XP_057512043.1 RPM1-interacting protein 4-like [Actinidia eriantha]
MAQRSHVPKFGNWESEDNVPYTVYFEKARKGKGGGKMINPNNPQENPDMFPNSAPPADQVPPPPCNRTEPEEPIRKGPARPIHDERRVSREDGDLRQFTDSPARNDNPGRKASGESAHQRPGGRGPNSGRPVRSSAGSEYSIDRSPLHPHHQAKVMDKGGAAPSGEGQRSYDSSHGAPGKSKMRPRGDETPDGGAAVPRFGEWDEKNPAAADQYTGIFNRVREERHGTPKSPGVGNVPSYGATPNRSTNDSIKCGCFQWCRK